MFAVGENAYVDMATGVKGEVKAESHFGKHAVVIGTLGKNKFIGSLIAEKSWTFQKSRGME